MIRAVPFLLLLLVGCSYHPNTDSYRQQYSHLKSPSAYSGTMRRSDYFLMILVDARRLDYSDSRSLLTTLAKHPSDGSKNGDVGHSWIYVEGFLDGQRVFLEGGKTGDLGDADPCCFEGVVDLYEKGDPNPIRYIWYEQEQGFFQWGNGGHRPTYAAKVNLTEEQFLQLVEWMSNYDFSGYCLKNNQCCNFAQQAAAQVGWEIDTQQVMYIDQQIDVCGHPLVLWSDPKYSKLIFTTPDELERCLVQSVVEREAEYALFWYLTHRPLKRRRSLDDLLLSSSRLTRFLILQSSE